MAPERMRALLFSIVFIATYNTSFEQLIAQESDPFATNWEFVKYSKKDGLPEDVIVDILQDSRGIMWLITPYHVVKYDGFTFTSVKCVIPNVRPHFYRGHEIDDYGRIWLSGRTNGIILFDTKLMEFIHLFPNEETKAPTLSTHEVISDSDGTIWYRTSNGIMGVQPPENNTLNIHDFLVKAFETYMYSPSYLDSVHSSRMSDLQDLSQIGNLVDTTLIFEVEEEKTFLIWCSGEFKYSEGWVDRGWIETEHNTVVWDFRVSAKRHCGGFGSLHETVDTVKLKPGRYRIRYQTNDLLSYQQWQSHAYPKNRDRWGMKIIPYINEIKLPLEDQAKSTQYLPTNFIMSLFRTVQGQVFFSTPQQVLKISKGTSGIHKAEFKTVAFDSIHFPIKSQKAGLNKKSLTLSLSGSDDGDHLAILSHPIFIRDSLLFRPRWTGSARHLSSSQLVNNIRTALFFDDQNILWFQDDPPVLRRVSIFHKLDSLQLNYLNLPSPYHLWSIFMDSQGNIWLATRNRALIKLKKPAYHIHQIPLPQSTSAEDITFTTIAEDEEESLWIDTRKSGLLKYNLETKGFTAYKADQLKNNINSNEGSLFIDSHGNRWYSHDYSIQSMPKGSTEFSTVLRSKERLPIIVNESQHMLLGKLTDFNQSPSYRYFCFNNQIFNPILKNSNYWRYQPGLENEYFFYEFDGAHVYSLIDKDCNTEHSHDILDTLYTDIWFLQETAHNYLWIGTYDQGLIRYNVQSGISDNFTKADGLLSNFIVHGFEDDGDRLWLLSDLGMNVLDIKAQFAIHRLPQLNEYIHKYNLITDVERDPKNYLFASNNHIFILGQKFIHHFDVDEAIKSSSTAQSAILDISIRNSNSSSNSINISGKDLDLHLTYQENNFAIRYTGILFNESSELTFAYKLNGLHDDWTFVGKERIARFINVDPGDYTFHVKSANAKGDWGPAKQLSITIHPPWYWNLWTKLMYMIILVLSIYSLYRYLLNRQLEKQKALRLQQLDDLKTRLYTNVTHEFRSPLTIILGMTDKIRDYVTEGEINKFNDGTKLIRSSGQRLLKLVNQMLDLSKVDAGHSLIRYQQQNIIPYINYLVEAFHSLALDNQIVLKLQHSVDQVVMDFDEDIIQKILSNLISNAINFSFPESIVFINTSPEKGVFRIEIRDTGQGISEADAPHIFDRFYQVDKISRTGTGVGLALTKQLVIQLNGNIWVESQINKGSTFHVSLPISNKAPLTNQIQTKLPPVNTLPELTMATGGDNSRPLILIIEDNREVAYYIGQCLEQAYQLIYAEDGEEGIYMAIEATPDFIISDVMMPKKLGYDVVAELKNDIRTSHIPIILLTAKTNEQSKIKGLEKGADAYLTKPFNKEELLIRIEQLIQLRQTLQKKYSTFAASTKPDEGYHSEKEDKFILGLRELILDSLTDDLTVPILCQKIGMSRSQLHRKLSALTNQSTTQFIRMTRFQKAKEFLLATDLTISEIAYETGFSSPAYFTRMFTKEMGVNPTTYRNR